MSPDEETGMRAGRWWSALVVATVVGMTLAGCSGGGGDAGGGGASASRSEAGPGAAPAPSANGRSAEAGKAAGSVRLVDLGNRIVRTATVNLEVRKGGIGDAITQATEVAARHKGIYVAASTSLPPDGDARGQVTFRVPGTGARVPEAARPGQVDRRRDLGAEPAPAGAVEHRAPPGPGRLPRGPVVVLDHRARADRAGRGRRRAKGHPRQGLGLRPGRPGQDVRRRAGAGGLAAAAGRARRDRPAGGPPGPPAPPGGGHGRSRLRSGRRLSGVAASLAVPAARLALPRPPGALRSGEAAGLDRGGSMRDLAPNMTDYLETRASFRLEVPDTYNYARDVVDAWAAREPDKLALLAVGPDGGQVRRFSFADLARASDRAARFLAAQGVRKGDRVFVMLPRIPDWYDVVLGCIKLGAVPMPATTLLTPRDIAYRITQADAGVAVVDAEGAAKVDQVAGDCPSLRTKARLDGSGTDAGWLSWADGLAGAGAGPPEAEPTRADDPMLLYFTSGTVAYPKMVMHTQASLGIGHQITAQFWQDLKPSDLHWT